MDTVNIVKIKKLRMANIFPNFKRKNNCLRIISFCLYRLPYQNQTTEDVDFTIGECEIKAKFLLKKGITFFNNYRLNLYKLEIPMDIIVNNDMQNKLFVRVLKLNKEKKETKYIKTGIGYNLFDLKDGKYRTSKVWVDEKTNSSIYFRQSIKNAIYITVREKKKTDNRIEIIKLFCARIMSKIFIKKNLILLFEKESSKYEESASVLYEKLIDNNYKNVYYILDKNYQNKDRIEEKYKKNIIDKYSFKHYLYFFKSNKFIGTETLGHAIDLRTSNRYAIRKVNSKNISYVFLQHGVMYMVSLNSGLRSGFNNDSKKFYKVVVSSKEEANHFIELGGFDSNNLYVTGLPKYDKSILNKDADKITIMPTWRRWEYNNIRNDCKNTNYYKMLQRIYEAIPEEYKEKIIILPHPLIIDFIKNSKLELAKYIPDNMCYDEILKDTKLLITDYSSIAYDSFYRGSNIIFYWEEKEQCLKNYGENSKLMLNEENVFGDIAYNSSDLKNIIKNNYNCLQVEKYKKKYRKIVEFKDGNNTNRLIEELQKDEFM